MTERIDLATSTLIERARFFATAVVGVRRTSAGPETGFAMRYCPTLGGHRVRIDPDPKFIGYECRSDAVAAAREYRRQCREVLAEAERSAA